MSTFAERKKAATPAEATVRLCLDLRLHDRLRTAYMELRRLELAAKRNDPGELRTLDEAPPEADETVQTQLRVVEEIETEIEAASELYVFRKLQQHQWSALGEEYPPTEEQIDEAKKARDEDPHVPIPDIDGENFWPAAIAACSHDPKLTEADARWLRDGDDEWTGLPPTEFSRITAELRDLHSTGVRVPKELLHIARALRHGRNGTTPADEASPSRSSAAGSRKKANRTG